MKKFNGKRIKEVERYPESMRDCDMTLWEVFNADDEKTGEYLMFANNNPCTLEYMGTFANIEEVNEYMEGGE